jgi:uncharacterized protein with NRDE domain
MCLILVAFISHPRYKLIMAGNRDEYYDRPTAQADFWDESPRLLGGRDLRSRGTWMGITRNGRIAVLTNYRDPSATKNHRPSRGKLVSDFLSGNYHPVDYLEHLNQRKREYNGFNLIIGQHNDLYWYSNRGSEIRRLVSGIYGLSNSLLDTPWPKVLRGKEAFKNLLSARGGPTAEGLFHILDDRSIPDDEYLPDTGVGREWERILSPIFVKSPTYGTRTSTLLFITPDNWVNFIEKTFDPERNHSSIKQFEFQIES